MRAAPRPRAVRPPLLAIRRYFLASPSCSRLFGEYTPRPSQTRGKTAEGEAGRITLSPPGSQDRTERELLLKALDITEAEFITPERVRA